MFRDTGAVYGGGEKEKNPLEKMHFLIEEKQRIYENYREFLNKIDFFLNKSRLIPAHSDYFRIILIFYGFFCTNLLTNPLISIIFYIVL